MLQSIPSWRGVSGIRFTARKLNNEPIPGYRLVRFLGRGGAGEVWEAEAPGGVAKAIKITLMDLSDDTLVRRELEGLQKIRSIRHPFLIAIDRFEVVDGLLIIVMELADRSVFDRLNECRRNGYPGIPRAEVLAYFRETAEVLDKLGNEHGLQHLDIKPTNLMLSSGHIKVADFGLLQAADADLSQGTLALSPGYAPPELFNGKIEPSADQYALAVTFVELMTGHRPYSATNIVELIAQLSDTEPDFSGLDDNDRAVIRKAMHVDPGQRFTTCMELVEALYDPATFAKSLPKLKLSAGRRPDDSGWFAAGGSGLFVPGNPDATAEPTFGSAETRPSKKESPKLRESWPSLTPASPNATKARPLFVKGQTPKVEPKVEPVKPATISRIASSLFPSPTSSVLPTDSRVASDGKSVTAADELHDTFLASLPLEIYALKLRGLLDALGPEILVCSERETVFGFLKKGWFSFSGKTGIYVRINTIQHNPESDLRVVDMAVWNTARNISEDEFGQMATMLIRVVKSFFMANERDAAQTFDLSKVKDELWRRS